MIQLGRVLGGGVGRVGWVTYQLPISSSPVAGSKINLPSNGYKLAKVIRSNLHTRLDKIVKANTPVKNTNNKKRQNNSI